MVDTYSIPNIYGKCKSSLFLCPLWPSLLVMGPVYSWALCIQNFIFMSWRNLVSISLFVAESSQLHGKHHQRIFVDVLALKVLQGGKSEGGLKGSNAQMFSFLKQLWGFFHWQSLKCPEPYLSICLKLIFNVLTLWKGNALVLLTIRWKIFTNTHGKFNDLAFSSWDWNQALACVNSSEQKCWLLAHSDGECS